MPRAKQFPPASAAKKHAGEGISLTRAGFMIIAPPFVTAYHTAKARSEDWFAHLREKDSNPRPRISRIFSDGAKYFSRTIIAPTDIGLQLHEYATVNSTLFFEIYIPTRTSLNGKISPNVWTQDLRWSDIT